MESFTDSQLRYLIAVQTKSHRKAFIQSLINSAVIRTAGDWQLAGVTIPDNAKPLIVTDKLDSIFRVIEYFAPEVI